MKFICNISTLAKEVAKASSIALGKNSLSMTSCILLSAENGLLTIKANDGKMGFISTIPVSVEEPGATAVFADKFSSVLKNLPEGDIEIASDEKKLSIKPTEGKKLSVNIKTMDASKFPKMDEPSAESVKICMKTSELTSMADAVAFSVSEDSSRPFLTGVYLESLDGKLTLVATDGRRLAISEKEGEFEEIDGAIVPVRFFQTLKAIEDESVIIYIGGGAIHATSENYGIYSSLIAGKYPNYRRVIPESLDYSINVKTSEFDRAVTLTSIMTDAKTKRILIGVSEGEVAVIGEESDFGNSRQSIGCSYDGPEFKALFNVLLLTPCLKKIGTTETVLSFNDGNRAWVICPSGDESVKYVIMPMSI